MIFDVKQQTASPTYLVHAEAEKHQERPNFRLVWIGLSWAYCLGFGISNFSKA